MGRYLGLGIVTSIQIVKKTSYEEFDVKKVEKEILEGLEKYFDLNNYNRIDYINGYEFKLKDNFFNENIHNLIKEINPIIDCEEYLRFYINDNNTIKFDDNFNQKNYPLMLKKYGKNNKGKEESDFYSSWNLQEEDYPWYPYEYLFFNEYDFCERVTVNVGFIKIWVDCDKYCGEDETQMLKIMSLLAHNYFENPLSKNMMFGVFG